MAHTLSKEQLEEMEAQKHLQDKIWTSEKFTKMVLEHAEYYDLDIIDAIVDFCHDHEIDIDVASNHLMSDKLIEQIEENARERNLIYETKKNTLRFE